MFYSHNQLDFKPYPTIPPHRIGSVTTKSSDVRDRSPDATYHLIFLTYTGIHPNKNHHSSYLHLHAGRRDMQQNSIPLSKHVKVLLVIGARI